MPALVHLQKVERQPLPGYSFYGLVPLLALGSRLAFSHHRRYSGNPPKAPPRGYLAATGGGVGQTYERGFTGLLPASVTPDRCPGSVRHKGKAPKLGYGLVGRSFPHLSTPHHPAPRGDKSLVSVYLNSKASEARQAVGGAHVGKCSVGVGMWST